MRLYINHELVDMVTYTCRRVKNMLYLYVCFNCRKHENCYLYKTTWAPMDYYISYRAPVCHPFRINTIF